MAITIGSSPTLLAPSPGQNLVITDFATLAELLGGGRPETAPTRESLTQQNQGAQLLRDVGQGNAQLASGWESVAKTGNVPPELKELLDARSDLKMEDLTFKGKLLPVVQDPESRQILAQNSNLRPQDLTEMQSAIQQSIKDPGMARSAYKMVLEALQGGKGDVKPQALGELFGAISQAVGKSPEAGAVALSMFGDAKDLLKGGKTAEDVAALVTASKDIAGGDKNSALSVANAFKTAADGASLRPDLGPQGMKNLAKVIANRFPGQDNSERVRAFESGLGMLGGSASLDHKGLDTMLARGQAQGLKGEGLLRSFETQGQAGREGRVNVGQLADAGTKSLRFDREGRLKPESTLAPTLRPQQPTRPGQPALDQPGQGPRRPVLSG